MTKKLRLEYELVKKLSKVCLCTLHGPEFPISGD